MVLGSLVRFVSAKRTDHVKDSPIYDAIPEMLIMFAEKCRMDSVFRLLARTVQHSFDSRIPSMKECLTKLIVDEAGEIGVHIQSKIPAPMRKKTYDTDFVATTTNLMCCKCSCQCGSKGNECIACVHALVRLHMVSLLLHEHLAENILCKLAARLVDSIDSDGSIVLMINSGSGIWVDGQRQRLRLSNQMLCCLWKRREKLSVMKT